MERTADGAARLDVLDGLRGLAIVMVLIFHAKASSGLPLEWHVASFTLTLQTIGEVGSIGVSLFFFISGFCLFYPYARHCLEGARRPTLGHYAYRRFIKIVPSYLIAVTAMAIIFHGKFASLGELFRHYAAHIFFIHYFFGPTYFSSISGPFWTLAIEVEFYVLFPLIALAMMRFPTATFVAAGLFAISYRASLTGVNDGNFYYVNALQGHIDTFVTGMLGAYVFVRLRSSHVLRLAWVRYACGFAAIAAFTYFFISLTQMAAFENLDKPWNGYRWELSHRVMLELLFLTIALGALFTWNEWRAVVANRVLMWFSLISYNLYLWHNGIIVSCHDYGIPCSNGPNAWRYIPHWDRWSFLIEVSLSVAIAALITYFFERPLLRMEPSEFRAMFGALRRQRPASETA